MAGPQYVYVMKGLSRVYPGGNIVLQDIALAFLPGAKIGVLGSNGAGKSSLLRIMAGVDTDYQGEAWAAEGLRVGYLPQEPVLDPTKDVRGNVIEGVAYLQQLLLRLDDVMKLWRESPDSEMIERIMAEQADLQSKIDAAGAWDLDRRITVAMDALRCPPADADVTTLSGGEKRRVALARLLVSAPDMLLLDEPTNHLDAESVAWLERYLSEYKGTVVAVTHDRYFLDNVAGWILELDRGRGYPFKGNYTAWLEAKEKRLQQEQKQEDARQRAINHELEWIRQSPRARQAKSKARIKAYEELVAQARDAAAEQAQIIIPPGPRLGDLVLEINQLSKGFGERLLIDNLSLKVPPGAIVGIVGPNGAGKTTLMRIVSGADKGDKGSVRLGDTVKIGFVDQSRESLDSKKTVWEEISGGAEVIEIPGRKIPSRAFVAGFGFKGGDQQKKVGQLSGGERNRVHLAKVLKSGANLLMLDEPSNDLDVDTLRALEDALLQFPGCVIVTSHDRWFLDRIATHIIAFENESQVVFFEGNYQDYELDRRRRLGVEADQPHRTRFKRLMR
ncbi:MAG: energy-dependent translational throttle protein EttA [Alphaproteobacteria bacterium]|nr:energy-dependent translational throttle protein EttA [Alphaproteobacteria bacterium]